MRDISKEELNKILKEHSLWLKKEEWGKRADLTDTNLIHINLRFTDLRYAKLVRADLKRADLTNVDLEGADLTNADLSGTKLAYADLSHANLSNADLSNADLSGTYLTGANLSHTNLQDANLKCADLRYANLEYVKTNIHTIGYNLACPEEGSFIGYKKANKCIVKLLILEDAKRSSSTTTKCRCDKAKVLDIENIKTGKKVNYVRSDYYDDFIYKVGEIVTVDDFDDNRWNECSTGIHFFMNKNNAINY